MDKKCETKKKKSLSTFAKEHKKEIITCVLTIGTIVTGIVIYKKYNFSLKEVMAYSNDIYLEDETVKECITNLLLDDIEIEKNCDIDNNSISKIINVPDYIRKLPKDYKHSKNAAEAAEKLCYNLLDNETFVKSYSYHKTRA